MLLLLAQLGLAVAPGQDKLGLLFSVDVGCYWEQRERNRAGRVTAFCLSLPELGSSTFH